MFILFLPLSESCSQASQGRTWRIISQFVTVATKVWKNYNIEHYKRGCLHWIFITAIGYLSLYSLILFTFKSQSAESARYVTFFWSVKETLNIWGTEQDQTRFSSLYWNQQSILTFFSSSVLIFIFWLSLTVPQTPETLVSLMSKNKNSTAQQNWILQNEIWKFKLKKRNKSSISFADSFFLSIDFHSAEIAGSSVVPLTIY